MFSVALGIDPAASHVLCQCSNSALSPPSVGVILVWVSTHLWFSLISLHAAEGLLNLTLDFLLLEAWLWWPVLVSTQRDWCRRIVCLGCMVRFCLTVFSLVDRHIHTRATCDCWEWLLCPVYTLSACFQEVQHFLLMCYAWRPLCMQAAVHRTKPHISWCFLYACVTFLSVPIPVLCSAAHR